MGTATPQRATIAGSPQAFVPGESGLVLRNNAPSTLTGRIAPSSVQNLPPDPSPGSTCKGELQAVTLANRIRPQAIAAIALNKIHNGTGQCSGDTRNRLNLGDDKPSEFVHGSGLGFNNYVVWSSDVLGDGDPRNSANRLDDGGRLTDFGLN